MYMPILLQSAASAHTCASKLSQRQCQACHCVQASVCKLIRFRMAAHVQGASHDGSAEPETPAGEARRRGGSAALKQLSMVQESDRETMGRDSLANALADSRTLETAEGHKSDASMGVRSNGGAASAQDLQSGPASPHGRLKSGGSFHRASAVLDAAKAGVQDEEVTRAATHKQTPSLLQVC